MISLYVLLLLGIAPVIFVDASSCPAANPNDNNPDDVALQACLNAGGTITLDPGNPGYIINIGLNITRNHTIITSSAAPTKATLLGGADLSYPIIQTAGIIYYIILKHLIVNGNKDNRATRNLINCVGTDNHNYLTTNIMLPGYVLPGGVWSTWDPSVFIDSVIIHDVDTINSPCGAGIGIMGRNFEIYNTNVSNNGWDDFNNPQGLTFPYADGINAAVSMNAYVHNNIIIDNTNMQVAAGPGPYSRVENNIILQINAFTQCGINCWPTNVWVTYPIWWHPAPWDLAHSAVTGNIIWSLNTVTAGSYIGIALGAQEWANYTLYNAGFVYNNSINGSDVNLMVDGVLAGTVWANTFSSPSSSGGKMVICSTPQNYTVAKSANMYLQPGWNVLQFFEGTPCAPTGENIQSTVDNSQFISWTINGVVLPEEGLSGPAGAQWPVEVTFLNTGTSVWQDIAGDNGYKLGDALNQAAPFWGVYRATFYNEIFHPNSEVTFSFTITLPSTPGTYLFQWQMVQELVDWFGETTPAAQITVE